MNGALRAIGVGGFKAFDDRQRLTLRPITLVYGPNSAGKSSIIQTLALAHEAEFADDGSLDVHRTTIGGASIDLGGFRQFVHRGEAARRVEWNAELDARAVRALLPPDLAQALADGSRVSLDIAIGIATDDHDRPLRGAEPRVVELRLVCDDDELARLSRRPGFAGHPAVDLFRLDRVDVGHAAFAAAKPEASPPPSARDETDAALGPSVWLKHAGFLPTAATVADEPGTEPGTDDERTVGGILARLLRATAAVIRDELGSLRYLGPLRSLPPRHLSAQEHGSVDARAGGGWAWDEVRTDAAVREAVNAWLGSARLGTPYELEVRRLLPLEAVRSALEDALLQAQYADDPAIAPLDAETGATADGWLEGAQEPADVLRMLEAAADAPGSRRELVLRDRRRNAVVTHRDVGVGISQVLPVLAMCYGSRDRLLAIEQPEIHLHPGLQAELGDVLIEAALGGRGNTLVVETHSEHLLLRIQRRIREHAQGMASADPRITAADVSVLYVEPVGTRSVVREMPLVEDGELAKSWPGGFFEEGLREQFPDA